MIALHIVLESLSIRIGNDYKITFSGLPIIIIAILYGPFAGFVVGLIGSVLSQILTFGITATTIYWIWPETLAQPRPSMTMSILSMFLRMVVVWNSFCSGTGVNSSP